MFISIKLSSYSSKSLPGLKRLLVFTHTNAKAVCLTVSSVTDPPSDFAMSASFASCSTCGEERDNLCVFLTAPEMVSIPSAHPTELSFLALIIHGKISNCS